MGLIYTTLFVSTIATLKSLNGTSTPKRVDGVFLGVADNGQGFPGWYRYLASSTAVENLPTVVSSNDGVGAWLTFEGGASSSGQSAFTNTTAAYTQPAVGSSVSVSVVNSSWLSPGQTVFIAGAGTYLVASIPNVTSISLTNLGYPNAIAVGSSVATPALISASGIQGAAGTPGNPGTPGATGTPGQSAFTLTTAAYTQPDVNEIFTVLVANTSWMAVGQLLYITSAGVYQVKRINDVGSINLENLGDPNSAASGTVILTGQSVVATGAKGNDGANGSISSAGSISLTYATIPNTDVSQLGLYADNSTGFLKVRSQSNGIANTIAFTDKSQTYNGTQGIAVNSLSINGGVVTADLSASNLHLLSLTTNVTNFTATNISTGTFLFALKEDSTGGRTLSFDTAKFGFGTGNSTLTTTANATNILSCVCIDGSTLQCVLNNTF